MLEDKGMKAQFQLPNLNNTPSGKISSHFDNFASNEKGLSFRDIQKKVDQIILGKKEIAPQELLQTQAICHRYQIQMEMVSKCAEAASSTVKKLQQGSA
jgi:hypothetical protein